MTPLTAKVVEQQHPQVQIIEDYVYEVVDAIVALHINHNNEGINLFRVVWAGCN